MPTIQFITSLVSKPQARIAHGSSLDPYIREYLIGPLPISQLTKLRPFDENYQNPLIPWNGRMWGPGDRDTMMKFVARELGSIGEVTM